VGGQLNASAILRPGKRHGTKCTGEWVGFGAGMGAAQSETLYRLRYAGHHAPLWHLGLFTCN